jgi:hypothetical protein
MHSAIRLGFPKVGDRVRFAIRYADAWRPVGWVRVGKDGSIYLGLLIGRPSIAKMVSQPAAKQVKVRYHALQSTTVPGSSRVSFKVSGEIHLGDAVLSGTALSSVARARQLCLMNFAHPARYRASAKRNPNDLDINVAGYAPVDDRPMYGALIVAPLNESSSLPAKLPNMKAAGTFANGFRGLTRAPDMIVQVILGHGPEGPWPEMPGVAVAAKSLSARRRTR